MSLLAPPMLPHLSTVYTPWYTCARSSSSTALLHQACRQEQSVLAAWAVSAVVGCCLAVLLHAVYTLMLCIMLLAGAGRVAGLCHCTASIQAPTIVLLCSCTLLVSGPGLHVLPACVWLFAADRDELEDDMMLALSCITWHVAMMPTCSLVCWQHR